MKKLFVIVLAAIGMVSCMNTDEVIEVNNDNAIAFADAFIENSVRAIIENGNDPNQFNQFNVWGWMKEGAVEAPVFNAKQVSHNGADWTYSPAQYWVPGFTYTFQALSSSAADVDGLRHWTAAETTEGNGHLGVVTFENVDGTEDLIYAAPAAVAAPNLGETAQPVELVFNHQLAKVKFDFTYDAQLSAALGNGMSVKAENIKMVVPKEGKIDYSETTPTWELVGAETTDLVFNAAGDELLTIPAEDYTYAISFDVNLYKDGAEVKKLVTKTSSVVLDVVNGCAYNFTATLTPENLQMDSIDFTPEVNPWNPGGNAGFEPSVAVVSDAFNLIKAADDDDIKNIVLNNDINLDDYISRAAEVTPSINVKEGKSLTIDLAGYNISGTDKGTPSFGLINVASGASLNVINSADVDGKISLTAEQNRGWNAYSSVISNQRGTLTVGEGVVIEHLGGTDMAYGIDNLTNTGAQKAITTIDGATVKSPYRAIRQFLNSTAEGVNNELYVKSGVIEGANKSIWMQNANAKANPGKLVVEAAAQLKGDVMVSGAGAATLPVEVSVAADALEGESKVIESNFSYDYYVALEDGVYVVKTGVSAAKLYAAIEGVADGGTITLAEDVNITEGVVSSGTWVEGIYYVGDKSFTIDLNGKTLTQNGCVNDYLISIKNEGSKPNTITFKNGKLDAGTTAYCAICTSTFSTQKITVNLENVEVVNNNSNGATIKVRGGAELNVKAGTKIVGKDSYVGIESYGATTNIYEGAEIYQNGTSSYAGSLVGVSGNGIVNVYGGKGTSKQGGFIAMTSGGTINVYGGEWIANSNGTYANSNQSVLIAQSANGAKSIVNVYGGTFKGGYNCYGNAVGDAQINIKGGNFNADPAQYLVTGYTATESNGIYSIVMGVSALNSALAAGGEVILTSDITIAKSETGSNGYGATGIQLNGGVIDGNGKEVSANVWSTWDSAISATGGTIKNLTVADAMRGIFMPGASGDVYIDNVIFDNVIYTFNSDGGNKNYGVYISNSTLNGWTSHSDVHKEVVYTNCNFGKGNGYAYCRPYGPTSFVGCDFAAGFQVEAIGKITFENCTIGGVALTAENLSTLVTSGSIANATVK